MLKLLRGRSLALQKHREGQLSRARASVTRTATCSVCIPGKVRERFCVQNLISSVHLESDGSASRLRSRNQYLLLGLDVCCQISPLSGQHRSPSPSPAGGSTYTSRGTPFLFATGVPPAASGSFTHGNEGAVSQGGTVGTNGATLQPAAPRAAGPNPAQTGAHQLL